MKKIYLILFLLKFIQILPEGSSWWPPFTFNIYNTATANPNNSNTTTQAFDQKTLQDTFVDLKSKMASELTTNLSSGIADALLKKLSDKIKEKFNLNLPNKNSLFTKKNVFYATITAFLGTYAYNYIKIYSANKQLAVKNSWSCWKSNLTLEQLLEGTKENLNEELKNDAQRFYGTRIETFFNPIETVKNAILAEKNCLKNYLNLIEILKKYHLAFLFPINDENTKLAQEKLNRLSFMIGLIN